MTLNLDIYHTAKLDLFVCGGVCTSVDTQQHHLSLELSLELNELACDHKKPQICIRIISLHMKMTVLEV